jgi:hypothetical protein
MSAEGKVTKDTTRELRDPASPQPSSAELGEHELEQISGGPIYFPFFNQPRFTAALGA